MKKEIKKQSQTVDLILTEAIKLAKKHFGRSWRSELPNVINEISARINTNAPIGFATPIIGTQIETEEND